MLIILILYFKVFEMYFYIYVMISSKFDNIDIIF